MKNKFLKASLAGLLFTLSSAANAGLIVGVAAPSGVSGTYNELTWTLGQLGYAVTNDFTLADVVINASGNNGFGNLPYFAANGIGYIQIGDWHLDWTPNSYRYDATGPYTLQIDNSHAITTGLDLSWTEFGFHNNNSSWNPNDLAQGYLGWDTNLTHQSIIKSTSIYSHDRVVTAYDMGNYNAVYLGVEAFGHGANQNSVKLLGNSIEWAATGVVQPATVSESSSLSVFMVGLLGLALRRFKTKQGK